MIDSKELRTGNLVRKGSDLFWISNLWGPSGLYDLTPVKKGEPTINRMPGFALDYIAASEEILFQLNFTKIGGVLPTYNIDISLNKLVFRELSVAIQPGNQYISIREGQLSSPREKDDLMTLHNGDYLKQIYVHQVQNFYYMLTHQELILEL